MVKLVLELILLIQVPALEITSPTNNKGVLLPRLTQTQRLGISSPASGLLVYQTNGSTNGLYYYGRF